MDFITKFVEFIQSIVKFFQNLVKQIRDVNDKKDDDATDA